MSTFLGSDEKYTGNLLQFLNLFMANQKPLALIFEAFKGAFLTQP